LHSFAPDYIYLNIGIEVHVFSGKKLHARKKKKKKLNTTTMLSFQKGKEKDTINYSNKLLFSNRHGQECTIYRFPSQIERVIGPSLTKGN